jgi:CheY-like chemotaxis protein
VENARVIKSVLLVDDDPVVLQAYRDGLLLRGFQVETATDGLAALKTLTFAFGSLKAGDCATALSEGTVRPALASKV